MRSASGEWIKRQEAIVAPAFLTRYGPLLGSILWARGLQNDESAEYFLNPKLDQIHSPFILLNMEASAKHLAQAILKNEKIAVYADYDMDGMSGLALLVSFFREISFSNFLHFQPDRLSDGYGVHASAVEALAEKGVKHIITVDTGISAFDADKKCSELGIHFIITDHHKQINELPKPLLS